MVILILAAVVRAGTVATDGTLGPRTTPAGPAFSIGPQLGRQRGGNLFHSFSTFDLDQGDVATFTGPPTVHCVFARITGGHPSSIDGTIACTIPDAAFYLINPSGVVFGPDSSLDVKGHRRQRQGDRLGQVRDFRLGVGQPVRHRRRRGGGGSGLACAVAHRRRAPRIRCNWRQ
jgi:filamentous hemagglutinin family protein